MPINHNGIGADIKKSDHKNFLRYEYLNPGTTKKLLKIVLKKPKFYPKNVITKIQEDNPENHLLEKYTRGSYEVT